MLKKIKECSFQELFDYVNDNLVKVLLGEKPFPHAILMFVNNPNIKEMTPRDRRNELKQIFSEMKPDLLDIQIDIKS